MGPGPVLHIADRIHHCHDRRVRLRQPGVLRRQVIHRLSLEALGIPDDELDAAKMAAAFRKGEMKTGGEVPYTFLIRAPEGIIEQCLPVQEVGPHARVWNEPALGIAIVGDFRKHEPDPKQWHSALRLCAALRAWGLEINGHTELPNATNYKGHSCPGKRWPIRTFRSEANALANNVGSSADANSLLARAGVIYGG